MTAAMFVSPGGDGWRNMAIEEYLMDRVGPDDAVVCFYINDRAVIIGRSQNPWAECRLAQMEADGVQLVRRITGGGAVYHDRGNLNFSFIMGKNRYDRQRQTEMILDAVRGLGIPCEATGRNDLLADRRKFSGHAYCERGHARLHHGTLLVSADLDRLQYYLNVDAGKLAAKGVKSVRSRVCNLSEFRPGIGVDDVLERMIAACRSGFDGCREMDAGEIEGADLERYVAKHASEEWRLGKTPKFDCEISTRFPWGGVQLLLRLNGGIIEDLDAYTDANDAALAEEIRRRLRGARFGSAAMARALREGGGEQLGELADYAASLQL